MRIQKHTVRQVLQRFTIIFSIVTILVSCQLIPSTNNFVSTASTTAQAPSVTPPTLPDTFQTSLLNPLDTPHTYIPETCRYLRNKWNPLNAPPGTVAMVILFKNINRGTAELPDSISVLDFMDLMQQLKAQGFEAVTAKQLQAFMERNIPIPQRSVLLIQDGNQSADYFDKNFGEYWLNWKWPVVNGWVSDARMDEDLLHENVNLENMGFVDHQARGVSPDVKLSDDSAKAILARELQGSVEGFANEFGKTPTTVIWPNGGFGIRPVEVARQLRFKLGFTSNMRGPIMYNWVPLADAVDPTRPELTPEGFVHDPLMTLPVYSPNEALTVIDTVRAIGKAAGEYADQNKEIEHQYYETVCEPTYGPMPSP